MCLTSLLSNLLLPSLGEMALAEPLLEQNTSKHISKFLHTTCRYYDPSWTEFERGDKIQFLTCNKAVYHIFVSLTDHWNVKLFLHEDNKNILSVVLHLSHM